MVVGALAPALGGEAPVLLVSAPTMGLGFFALGSAVVGALALRCRARLLVSFPIIGPLWADASEDPKAKNETTVTTTSFFMYSSQLKMIKAPKYTLFRMAGTKSTKGILG